MSKNWENDRNAAFGESMFSESDLLLIKKALEDQIPEEYFEETGPIMPYNENIAKEFLKTLSLSNSEDSLGKEEDELVELIRASMRNSFFYCKYLNALKSHFSQLRDDIDSSSKKILGDICKFLVIMLAHKESRQQTIELIADFLSVLIFDRSFGNIARILRGFKGSYLEALLSSYWKKVPDKIIFMNIQAKLIDDNSDTLFRLMLFNIQISMKNGDVDLALEIIGEFAKKGGAFVLLNGTRTVITAIQILGKANESQVSQLIDSLEPIKGSQEVNWLYNYLKEYQVQEFFPGGLQSAWRDYLEKSVDSELSSLTSPDRVRICLDHVVELQELLEELSVNRYNGELKDDSRLQEITKRDDSRLQELTERVVRLELELQRERDERERFQSLVTKAAEGDTESVTTAASDQAEIDRLRAENERLRILSEQRRIALEAAAQAGAGMHHHWHGHHGRHGHHHGRRHGC